jgi:hypothetical protein
MTNIIFSNNILLDIYFVKPIHLNKVNYHSLIALLPDKLITCILPQTET